MLLKYKLSIVGMLCVEVQESNNSMSLDPEECLDQGARNLPGIFAPCLLCSLFLFSFSVFFFNFSFLSLVLHSMVLI